MIIIIGDSWGVGEWDKDCNLGGPGFGQYLMLHDQVCNLSVGAASNSLALERLNQFLKKYQIDSNDTIYWIVTCPSRDIEIEKYLSGDRPLIQILLDSLNKSFLTAQKLAEINSTEINLIGGLCDLTDIDLSIYPNLNIKISSWGQLIDEKYNTSLIYPTSWNALGQVIKNKYPHRFEEWQDITDLIINKNQSWRKIFHTDGTHPDRHGHKILHDHLYPEWAWKIR